MKRILKLATPALLSVCFLFSSCQKDEKKPEPTPAPAPAPPPPTNTEKLTGKNFKITASTVDPALNVNGTMITNYYAQMADCVKDDLYKFNSNLTATLDENALKCNANDPQTLSGTWAWNTNETILTITFGTYVQSYNIITNDGTTLKFSYVLNDNGINYTFTDTYTKQ